MCVKIMNTEDSKMTWLVTRFDLMFVANPVLSPFWLADQWTKINTYNPKNFHLNAEQNLNPADFRIKSEQMSSSASLHSTQFHSMTT